MKKAPDRRGSPSTHPRASRKSPELAPLFLSLLLALLELGCGREPGTPEARQPEPGGTLRIAILEPFDFLTPVRGIRSSTFDFMVHVTPPLGRLNERGGVDLLLARRAFDLGPRLDYRLRRVFWEDGQPVTAHDFVLTSKVMLHPGAPGGERRRFDLVKELLALSDSTLSFRFLAFSPQRYQDALLMPLPSHVLGEDPDPRKLNDWPITHMPLSCGPFRVEESSTYRLVLARNPDSGFEPPHVERVDVRTMRIEDAVREFRAGDLDVIDDVPPDRVEDVLGVRTARVVALVGRSYLFLGWNLRDARFSDLAVRYAAAMAVDVERLIQELTLGQGDRSRGPLVPVLGIVDSTDILAHDPRGARRLLDDAGWRDTDHDGVRDRRGARLDFHILVSADAPVRLGAAEAIARDLSRVGMHAQVRVVPLREFVPRLQGGRFESFMGRWYPDLDADLEPVWHSASTDRFNYGGYASATVDSLLVRLRHEDPGVARKRLFADLQRRVYDDQPYLFLFHVPRFVVFSARVRGARPTVVSAFRNLPEWWIPRSQQRSPAVNQTDRDQ
ncbi:MAG: ABC transporter substrate-binding protein [Candidatus Krumholzibacteriia bacterium]